jgi:hypothetical protein
MPSPSAGICPAGLAAAGYTPGVNETPPAIADDAELAGDGGSAAPASAPVRVRRPTVVTILAGVQFLLAVGYGLILLALLAGGSVAFEQLLGAVPVGERLATELSIAAGVVVLGGLFFATLAAGILLLRMRQLGWTITMLLTGLGLASSIYGWVTQGSVLSIWLLAQVVTVFYLNQRQVRESFAISRPRVGDTLGGSRG